MVWKDIAYAICKVLLSKRFLAYFFFIFEMGSCCIAGWTETLYAHQVKMIYGENKTIGYF